MEKKGEGRNKGQKNTTEEERGGKRQGKGVLYQILDRIYAHSYRQSTLLSTYGSAEIQNRERGFLFAFAIFMSNSISCDFHVISAH